MITPLYDRVLITKVINEKTPSTILINNPKESSNIGIIIAIGTVGELPSSPKTFPCTKGDKIVYTDDNAMEVFDKGEAYWIIPMVDVLGVIEGNG